MDITKVTTPPIDLKYEPGKSGYEWGEIKNKAQLIFYACLYPIDRRFFIVRQTMKWAISLYGNKEYSKSLALIFVWGVGTEPVEFYSAWINCLDNKTMEFVKTSETLWFYLMTEEGEHYLWETTNFSRIKFQMIESQISYAVKKEGLEIENSPTEIEKLKAQNHRMFVEKTIWIMANDMVKQQSN